MTRQQMMHSSRLHGVCAEIYRSTEFLVSNLDFDMCQPCLTNSKTDEAINISVVRQSSAGFFSVQRLHWLTCVLHVPAHYFDSLCVTGGKETSSFSSVIHCHTFSVRCCHHLLLWTRLCRRTDTLKTSSVHSAITRLHL